MNIKSCFRSAILLASACALAAETLPPIACNMTALTSDQRKQLEKLGEHVISAITTSRELSDGYAFRVDRRKRHSRTWRNGWTSGADAARSTNFRSTSMPPTATSGSP